MILDLHSRGVIGWAVSNRMKRDLAIRALKMAVALRQPPRGCIHHTDRGSQYCSHDYQKLLRRHGFQVLMSSKGNCYDNSAAETFFKMIKAELIWQRSWPTRRDAEQAILHYINGFYKPASAALSVGVEKPGRHRTESSLNEHLGRHNIGTGPREVPMGMKEAPKPPSLRPLQIITPLSR